MSNLFPSKHPVVFLSPIIWSIIFIVAPFFIVLVISLSRAVYTALPFDISAFPTLENFKVLFTDQIYITSFLQSFVISLASTFLTLLIAYPIAYKIAFANPKIRYILLLLIIAPFWTALLIRIYAWVILLKPNGILNYCLINLGIIEKPLRILYTKVAVIIGITYTYLPFMILPIFSALIKIDRSLIEAAEDLGSSPRNTFWHIIFPLSLPGVISGVILVFIPAIGEFVIPDILGGSQTATIGKIIWSEYFMNRNWTIACAITVIFTAITLLPVMFIKRYFNRGIL